MARRVVKEGQIHDPVQVVPIDARALYTLEGPLSPEGAWMPFMVPAVLKGAIVRLKPPPGALTTDVDRVEAIVRESGAIAVHVAPWKRGGDAPQPVKAMEPRKSVREIVKARVDALPEEERARVSVVCEDVMGVVGL